MVRHTTGGIRRLGRYRKKGEKPPAEVVDHEMTLWGKKMLESVNTKLTCVGHEIAQDPVIFVGNHTSYIDMPAVMSLTPTNFVSKAEIGEWPLFGAAIKSVDTVLVKREETASRRNAAKAIAANISEVKRSIAVFPGGTTSIEERRPWRRGVFEIARMGNVRIQPFSLTYRPARLAAYVDDDVFVPHIMRLMRQPLVEGVVEFGPLLEIEDSHRDCGRVYAWVRRRHLLRMKGWGYELSEDAENFLREPEVALNPLVVG